jgi:excisionase family DNA binding protein
MPQTQAFLTDEETAELLRNTTSTLRRWRRKGLGPRWHRVGRKVLYRPSDVERWLRKQARGAA